MVKHVKVNSEFKDMDQDILGLDPSTYLPRDVFELVFRQLPLHLLVASSYVNKKWGILASSQSQWERRFALHFFFAYQALKRTKPLVVSWKVKFSQQYQIEYDGLTIKQKCLFSHCKESNFEDVILLCPSLDLFDLTTADKYFGLNPLNYSILAGATNILQGLYEEVVLPLNTTLPDGIPIIYYAISTQQPLATIRSLIAAGHNVDQAGMNGVTPLHIACERGYADIVAELIMVNASVDLICSNGNSPLIAACRYGYTDIVSLLLTAGAKHNQANRLEYTAFILAKAYGRNDIVAKLLSSGARADISLEINTPLYVASRNGHGDIVDALLKLGAKEDSKSTVRSYSPLSIASIMGHVGIVAHLLAAGASVDYLDSYDYTPLLEASDRGRHTIVKLLLAAGARADSAANQETSLYKACFNGHNNTVRELIAAGANVNKENSRNVTPLNIACKRNHGDIVAQLLVAGANVNQSDGHNQTPLHCAVSSSSEKIVISLLARGATVNEKIDYSGDTPLIFACESGKYNIVVQLLAAGATVDQKNHSGRTPLSIAKHNGYVNIVKLLEAVGAEMGWKKRLNKTSLEIAIATGNINEANLLALAILQRYKLQHYRVSDVIRTIVRARFFGFFGAKLDRLTCYHAVYMLREYVLGQIEIDKLEEYRSIYQMTPELKMIVNCYTPHPGTLINDSYSRVTKIMRHYRKARFFGNLPEIQDLKNQLLAISRNNNKLIEPYIAIAFIDINEAELKYTDGAICISAHLTLAALDPGFILTKEIIAKWISDVVISSSIADSFWCLINEASQIKYVKNV